MLRVLESHFHFDDALARRRVCSDTETDFIEHTVVVLVKEQEDWAHGQVVGFAVLNALFRLSAIRDQDYAEVRSCFRAAARQHDAVPVSVPVYSRLTHFLAGTRAVTRCTSALGLQPALPLI